MADEELFEPILENRTIVLNLSDRRNPDRQYVKQSDGWDFTVISMSNSIEWVVRERLSVEQVQKVLDDDRGIEVHITRRA